MTLRIRAKDDWQNKATDVVDIQWVWGKSYFWLLTFNGTVSCPTLLIFFSVLDPGSQTHRLMLVRRGAKTRGNLFLVLGLLARLCWAMPIDVF